MYMDKKAIRNKYKIMSYNQCADYCAKKHKNTSVIISITSYDGDLYEKIIKSDQNGVQDILYLSFADLEVCDSPKNCMQYEDAEKVVEFVNKWYGKVDTLIVHCEGGISRSAGVCAAIMRVKEGDDWIIFDSSAKHPNMTCYYRTLVKFGYDMPM